MLAKRCFYVSAALFLLALTYHLGARQADAQAPGNPVVAATLDGNGVRCSLPTVTSLGSSVARGWGPWRRALPGQHLQHGHGLHTHHLGQGQGGLPEVGLRVVTTESVPAPTDDSGNTVHSAAGRVVSSPEPSQGTLT